MELKSHSFTSKEPHVAREPQVADPWSAISTKTKDCWIICLHKQKTTAKVQLNEDKSFIIPNIGK